MKEFFQSKRFHDKSLQIIQAANVIIAEYPHTTMNLRQLYYQFVARQLLPNTHRSYKNLGQIINDGRLAGLIDWNAIEDLTRNLMGNNHWTCPQNMTDSAAGGYALDHWAGQECRVEVWIEKSALIGVISRICHKLDVDFFACRGYVSQSEQYRAGNRFQRHWFQQGQRTIVLHLGDHDPSGIDMTRDNSERLTMFADLAGPNVEVIRIALNMDQIKEYNPPPNPAKITDSRYDSYRSQFGDESWELDALNPPVLEGLIKTHVERYRDPEKYEHILCWEAYEKAELMRLAERYDEVKHYLGD